MNITPELINTAHSISWFDGILYIILGLGTYAAYRWIKKEMVKTLKKVSKQLQKASRLHKRQSEIVKKYVKKTENKRPKSRNRKKA